jgi:DNA-binding response OmpR family regulator
MARKATILIVEDDEDLRRLFRTALALAGYDVEEAGDGLEALHKVDHAPPDLVVLDIGLPHLSGLAVQQEIASNAVTRDTPIVIITGSTAPLSDTGATCILRKPVSPEQLVLTVRNCLASGARGAL